LTRNALAGGKSGADFITPLALAEVCSYYLPLS
jgi:hypothetical protein